MIKTTFWTFVLCALTIPLMAEEIVLTEVKSGSVAGKAPGAEKFTALKVGDVIAVGTWIMTLDDTDATIKFYKTDKKTGDENSSLQLGSYTKIKVEEFDAKAEKVTTKIKQRVGHITSKVDPEESKGNDYKVETPQITAAVKGTVSDYVADSDGTDSKVIRGKVDVGLPSGRTQKLEKGQGTDSKGTPSIDSKISKVRGKGVFSGSSGNEAKASKKNASGNTGGPKASQGQAGTPDGQIRQRRRRRNVKDRAKPPLPPQQQETETPPGSQGI